MGGEQEMSRPTKVDQRRLADGAEALRQSRRDPQTIEQAREIYESLSDGIRALQSMDDLGSPEANEAAWDDMLYLEKERRTLEAKWPKLRR